MDTFRLIDVRAAQIPDSVRKLKFLRREIERNGNKLGPSVRPMPATTILAMTIGVFAFALTGSMTRHHLPAKLPAPLVAPRITPEPTEKIWLVEKTPAYWVYSNGLQIRTEYLTESTVRHYLTWSRGDLKPADAESVFPAGIVFHTTESLMLPLEPGEAHSLVRTREQLLEYIRRGRLYNYVIDRFGQVFRVVPDDEVAFHAGHSIWADGRTVYEGLNDSFLGVAFEARSDESFVPGPAQVRSGRMLTDLLRSEYSIQASDCVTHAQVSVNPSNMQIGYHTDWGGRFPFSAFGLPDGYATPLPAVELFGFGYNHAFLEAIGGTPWAGLTAADADVRRASEAGDLSLAAYRSLLQHKYRAIRSQKHEPADRDRT